jgi:hypothetical protein
MLRPIFSNQLSVEIDAHAIIGDCAETICADTAGASLPVQRAEKIIDRTTPGAGLPVPQSKFTSLSMRVRTGAPASHGFQRTQP